MKHILTLEQFIILESYSKNIKKIEAHSPQELATLFDIPIKIADAYTNLFNYFIIKYGDNAEKEIITDIENSLYNLENNISPRKYAKYCKDNGITVLELKDILNKFVKSNQLFKYVDSVHWIDKLDDIFYKNYNTNYAITSTGTYVVLWYDNKKVGYISTRGIENFESKEYIKISESHIDNNHRGKGFGYLMYKALLDSTIYGGFCSYQPDRANKKQVPSIYKKLNYFESGDFWFVPK